LLYWLLYQKLFPYFRPFRSFAIHVFVRPFATLTALLIGLVVGPYVIQKLRGFQIGQYIRERGSTSPPEEGRHADHGWRPDRHLRAAAYPACGPICPIPLIWMVTLLYACLRYDRFRWMNYIKVAHKREPRPYGRAKLGLQITVSACIGMALVYLETQGNYSTRLVVPFLKRFRPDLVVTSLQHVPHLYYLSFLPFLLFTIFGHCRLQQCREFDRRAWTAWPSAAPSLPRARSQC